MTGTGEPAWDDERGYTCCGGYCEHGYRCRHRVWPATATPEVKRQAFRGDCIAPAHAQIEDAVVRGLDYQQRKRLTEILAQVWDNGFEYGQQVVREISIPQKAGTTRTKPRENHEHRAKPAHNQPPGILSTPSQKGDARS